MVLDLKIPLMLESLPTAKEFKVGQVNHYHQNKKDLHRHKD